eukprot:scaffold1697_cov180-Amphora_coffeaeformis.AAC.28
MTISHRVPRARSIPHSLFEDGTGAAAATAATEAAAAAVDLGRKYAEKYTKYVPTASQHKNIFMASPLAIICLFAFVNTMFVHRGLAHENVEKAIRPVLQDISHMPKARAKYAVFMQLGTNIHLFNELQHCVRNVAEGLPSHEVVDIHVALLQRDKKYQNKIRGKLGELSENINWVNVILTENKGADVGQFLAQLRTTQQDPTMAVDDNYEAVLKIHAKSDEQWRQRMTESLCGSPNQVTSILTQLRSQPDVDMVAALGTTFGPQTSVDSVYPRILEIYDIKSMEPAFDQETMNKVLFFYKVLGNTGNMPSPRIVAGTCFWIRWNALQVEKWNNIFGRYQNQFTRGYKENHGLEHIIERLIPTMLNGRIAEITPAPRIFALYFPQYHAIPENDRFWGVNFTEWTLLKPFEPKPGAPPVRKPLPIEDGGLGYYNLLDYETRKRQADLAKHYGVTGFVFYHYWFSGSHAPDDHIVMPGVLDKMLEDGEPNVPFMLSWANEPWSRRWSGEDEDVLLSQEYGDEEEWTQHFEYLLKFFQHPNYEKVNGRPAFAIYRPGHIGDKLKPMIALWQKLAKEQGFPGLHVIQTVSNFYKSDKTNRITKEVDIQASFQFWPQHFVSFRHSMDLETAATRDENLGLGEDKSDHVQYWGAFTSFDCRPRKPDQYPIIRTPQQFDEGLRESFAAMSAARARRVDKNLYFITAWNEWNEQALLEPDATYKYGFLEAVQKQTRSVSLNIVDT